MKFERDIVLIVGRNASGKTTTYNILKSILRKKKVKTARKPVADFFYILKFIEEDDKAGGRQHYHPWKKPKHNKATATHNHKKHPQKFPFMVFTQEIVNKSFYTMFRDTTGLPASNKIWIVEWAGGANNNTPASPANNINFSYSYIGKMLEEGILPSNWLQRVYLIIHPVMDDRLRRQANDLRKRNSVKDVKSGVKSSYLYPEVLDMLGKEDFKDIKYLFQQAGVPHIYTVQNNMNTEFIEEIREKGETAFNILRKNAETNQQRDIILLLGQASLGKSIIINKLKTNLQQRAIYYENKVLSDLPFLLKEINADAEKGGKGHYHPHKKLKKPHRHKDHDVSKSFVLLDNTLTENMQQNFFQALNQLPHKKSLYISEMTIGENSNPLSEQESYIDFSARTLREMIEKKHIPTEWLQRVYAVIHPLGSKYIRKLMNDYEYIESVKTGKESEFLKMGDEVLNMSGVDDFEALESIFRENGVNNIYYWENKGIQQFSQLIDNNLPDLLERYQYSYSNEIMDKRNML
jgi:GTPase SAR1 family protein